MIRRYLLRSAVLVGLIALLARSADAAASDLGLWFDVDGTVYLHNTTSASLSFDGYQIVSEAGLLDPSGWDSISDRIPARITDLISQLGAGSLTFGEANPTAFSLAELNLGGVATLPAHGKFSLGKPFKSFFDACSLEGFFWSAPGTGAQAPSGPICPEPSAWLLAALAALGGVAFAASEIACRDPSQSSRGALSPAAAPSR